MRFTEARLTAPPDAYQARTVLDGIEYDLGRPTDREAALTRAGHAGPGSTVVAVRDGTPMTRHDGTEYVIRTIE